MEPDSRTLRSNYYVSIKALHKLLEISKDEDIVSVVDDITYNGEKCILVMTKKEIVE